MTHNHNKRFFLKGRAEKKNQQAFIFSHNKRFALKGGSQENLSFYHKQHKRGRHNKTNQNQSIKHNK